MCTSPCALDWRCDGHCGWGDCDPGEDGLLTAQQLAGADSEGRTRWNTSDGSHRYAWRVRGAYVAEKLR